MPPLIDLTGQKFGRLLVLEQIKNSKRTSWKCQCSCGNIVPISTNSLRTKGTKSCGCLHNKLLSERNTTHGMAHSPEYRIWSHMIGRCHNSADQAFKNYGGRGITVCNKWRNDFMAFFNYAGKRPSPKLSIDRIDNNFGYKPGNVKWSNRTEQQNNTRVNHLITINGITKNITQWAKFVGIRSRTIHNRLRYGWSNEKAILEPVRHHKPYLKKRLINTHNIVTITV